MKRIATILTVFVLAFLLVAANNSQASDYEAFSKNLVKALKSDNQGLQVSAMEKVIRYGTAVNVDGAVLDIVRVYRTNKNEQFRQLALAAIHAMQNEWALGIVQRDYRFERNPKIKRMMAAVITANVKDAELPISVQ